MDTYLPFFLFGLWSVFCIGAGAWLMHRKQAGLPPIPEIDPARLFNWVRTGKDQPQEGDDPPPVESVNSVKGL